MQAVVLAGVDGCPAGWVCVTQQLGSGLIEASVVLDAPGLADLDPPPSVLCIDIPIGLTMRGPRRCDVEARRVLGPRASSVFDAPPRPALSASSQAEASAIRRHIENKGVSCQSFAIYRKVRELDYLLRQRPDLSERFREVHPEVCFWAWNKGTPMVHSKKRPAGREERLALTEAHFGVGTFRRLRDSIPRSCAASDDIIDALAALWTARRVHDGTARTLPSTPDRDSCNLRMEMCY
ncbi:MAG: hypothetical protein AMXMBFR58_06110 [Phycisphaerae bacterium]